MHFKQSRDGLVDPQGHLNILELTSLTYPYIYLHISDIDTDQSWAKTLRGAGARQLQHNMLNYIQTDHNKTPY